MTEEIPYTISEAREAAISNKMDIYHKELILWLCDEVEKFRTDMQFIQSMRKLDVKNKGISSF